MRGLVTLLATIVYLVSSTGEVYNEIIFDKSIWGSSILKLYRNSLNSLRSVKMLSIAGSKE